MADGLRRGAYVLRDAANSEPELILLASGSEVALILAAGERLEREGIAVRCVSMPSWELFEALPQAERDAVLPPSAGARLLLTQRSIQRAKRDLTRGGKRVRL
jgi:transketolase